ncbi:tetratricopeptide repeat protein [Methanoculleus sp. FWC-SCC1]|uniref:Tetratricopeptide repeat protein n=1 Tax=Methanoculleus frigidifontis TaxID=2584085 RepID=A0ABT8M8I4_9EURY|nr:tetratricopeptide repeat protein [Methanoculleus sp. FWC-SCC1]MDN7024231.1 tetratricopeptide repeat protein [Methanoculleus sp. FWC-SCC1]
MATLPSPRSPPGRSRAWIALLIFLLLIPGNCSAAADPGAAAASAIADEDWDGVLAAVAEGLGGQPENASLLCMQGYALRKLGRYPEAVAVVSEAIALDPKPVRYANRGYAYLATGNCSAALADAEAALLLDPADSTSWGVKAMALAGMGDLAGAESAVDRGLALAPESAHLWHVRGAVLRAAGNATGAAAALNRSLALDSEYSLPWPGMQDAREDLAAMQAATPAPAAPVGGMLAVAGILAVGVWSLRRR